MPTRLVHLWIVLVVGCTSAPAKHDPPPPPPPELRYVLVFQGDGMGPEHIRAGGMYVHGAAGTLSFEQFPARATMHHDNASGEVTDSAASATAMATGHKVDNAVVSRRTPGDDADLPTALELHQAKGRSAGLVTTSFLTDASPACYGAHAALRTDYAEIFHDYVTGSRPEVLFGGGDAGFDAALAETNGYTVVTDRTGLAALEMDVPRVAGGFGSGALDSDGTEGRDPNLPTLPELADRTLALLERNPRGFFAFIEHEGTDEASHQHEDAALVRSVRELDLAVQAGLRWVDRPDTAADWTNTLVLVVADHETGGLEVVEKAPQQGVVPAVTWSSGDHTSTPVHVFAKGVGAAWLNGRTIENTDVFALIAPAN